MFYTNKEMSARLAAMSIVGIIVGIITYCLLALVFGHGFMLAIIVAGLVAAYEALNYLRAVDSGFDV